MDKLFALYQYDDFPIIYELLSKFYTLSDDGRRQIIDLLILRWKRRRNGLDKNQAL